MIEKAILGQVFFAALSVVSSSHVYAAGVANLRCVSITEGGFGGALTIESNPKSTRINFDAGFDDDLQIKQGPNQRALTLLNSEMKSAGLLEANETAIGFELELSQPCSWYHLGPNPDFSCAADDFEDNFKVDVNVIGTAGRRRIEGVLLTPGIRSDFHSKFVYGVDTGLREFSLRFFNSTLLGQELLLPYLKVQVAFPSRQCDLDISEQ